MIRTRITAGCMKGEIYMQTVILAGGFGTRISEESHLKPKPMVEIGEKPILWHIMKLYSFYGFNDFIICLGYKGYMIKEFFADYYLHMSDVTFDFSKGNKMTIHSNIAEPWRVTLVDTGLNTQTGGRIKNIRKYIGDERFFLTYGDGVSDINIQKLLEFHLKTKKIATMTAVQPGGRYGMLEIDGSDTITEFREKSPKDGGWINAGFMVLEPEIFDYIDGNPYTAFEGQPLQSLAHNGQLSAYKHYGFWKCMDTKHDKNILENLYRNGKAPWMVWKGQ